MTHTTNTSWQFVTAGQPLTQHEHTLAAPQEDELLIHNAVSGINPVDWKFIADNPLDWSAGHIPGVDGCGIVVRAGSQADSSLLNTRVAYHQSLSRAGSFAAFTRVKADRVMRVPDALTSADAAALPCPLLTAWQAVSKIPREPGAWVLVAGLGAVNKLAVQLLNQAGFHVHALSASLTEKDARQLGVSQVHRSSDNLPRQYYAVIDAVSAEHAAQLVPLLKANGHVVCIQGRIEQPIDAPFTRTISYHEVALGALHQYGDTHDWHALMREGEALLEDVAQQRLVIDTPDVFDFDALNDALTHSHTSKQKTVVAAPDC